MYLRTIICLPWCCSLLFVLRIFTYFFLLYISFKKKKNPLEGTCYGNTVGKMTAIILRLVVHLFLFQLLKSSSEVSAFQPFLWALQSAHGQCSFRYYPSQQRCTTTTCCTGRRWARVMNCRLSWLHLRASSSITESSKEPYCIEDECFVPEGDSSSEDASLYSSTITTVVSPNGAPFTTLATSSSLDEHRRRMSSRGLLSPQGIIDGLLYIIPIVAPILAYYSYTNVQSAFVQFIDLLSNDKWVAVDGGLYQTQIITPAINGTVVPSLLCPQSQFCLQL